MRRVVASIVEAGRVREGPYGSDASSGLQGAFFVRALTGIRLKIIACDGADPEARGWEHVSVSCEGRCPDWEEMVFVKELFWNNTETVVQFHPQKEKHINVHPYVLHLWKRVDREFELPPPELIA